MEFTLIAAAFTPLTTDDDLNLSVIEKLAEWYHRNQLEGVFVCGTTGEGSSLSTDERIALIGEWMKMRSKNLKIIVHVGHNSIVEAQKLAAFAEKLKVDGISAIGPTYFKPANPRDLALYCQKIAESAPATPFYYYHMPGLNQITFDMHACLPYFQKIESFQGIKFTSENLLDFGSCVDVLHNSKEMLFGRDEILLSGIISGAHGAVGSFYNYFGRYYKKLTDNYFNKNIVEAQKMQRWIRKFCRMYMAHGGNVSVGKSIMKFIGYDCGNARLPLPQMSVSEESKLKADLEKIGFFENVILL